MSLRTKSFHSFKYIVIFLGFLGFFCGRETAPGIDEAKFINVYARYLVIEELKASDSLRIRYQNKLLADYSMTRTDLIQSISFYREDPDRWVVTLEKLRDRIKDLRTEAPGDTLKQLE
jgi:hypothetical protein